MFAARDRAETRRSAAAQPSRAFLRTYVVRPGRGEEEQMGRSVRVSRSRAEWETTTLAESLARA
ncbi:MAG: hypothetical protein ABFD84_14495, partial [Candidatus Polarisedimenticolia bacterium]